MTPPSGLTPAQTREAVAIAKRIDAIAKEIVAPLRLLFDRPMWQPNLQAIVINAVIRELRALLRKST